MARLTSGQIRHAAETLFPGGVNSPVRSFKAVGGKPVIAARGEGPFLYDVDGKRYIDFLMSWGALILGHAHPDVAAATASAAGMGNGFGLSTVAESDLAALIKEAFPSMEMMRLVNSGTEAVMSAVRTARGFTGRNKVIVFGGCYHGHSDPFLSKAGSGLATLGLTSSEGVPAEYTSHTVPARYNDLASVKEAVKRFDEDIAGILVEPVAGNMGVIRPEADFLEGLRKICDDIGSLLIFDEVITGFRIAWGGAQEKYGIKPDITVLGKIIGGGLPVGAFGGRKEIMESLAPLGRVYQAGTLSGNPVVMAAGAETLRILRREHPYREIEKETDLLTSRLSEAAAKHGIPLHTAREGGMFTIFFAATPPKDFESARRARQDIYSVFFRHCLEKGVLLPPSQWESAFLSLPHLQDDVLEQAGAVFEEALAETGRML